MLSTASVAPPRPALPDTAAPASSALLQALVDASPSGLAIVDRDLRFVAINPALAAINGLPVDAHIGRHIGDVLPGLADDLAPVLLQVLRTGEPIRDLAITGETPAAAGVIRHWEASYVPLHDAEGAIGGVGAIVVEVTDQRRLEDERARLLERITDGFVSFDREMRYVYVNEKAGQMLGRSPSEMIGQSYYDLYPEAIGTPFEQAYRQALRDQHPIVLEQWYEPWDRWFENRIFPSADGLTVFFSEITDRRRADAELRRLHDQERESRRAFEAIAKVHQAAIEAPSPTEMAEQALRAIVESVGADRGMYVAIEAAGGGARIIASTAAGPGLQLGSRVQLSSFALERLLVGEIASVENLATRRPTSDMERAAVAEGIASGMSVPLLVDGELEGAIHLGWTEPRSFTEDELDLLRAVADSMAALVRHVRLFEGEREARRLAEAATNRAERLHAVTDVGLEGLGLDSLLGELIERLRAATDTDMAGIMLRDGDTDDLVGRAYVGVDPDLFANVRMPIGTGFSGRIAAERRSVLVEDVSVEGGVLPPLGEVAASLAGTPLIAGDRVVGVIHVGTTEPRQFGPDDVGLLELVAARVAGAIERARLYEAAERHAAELETRVAERTSQLSEINAQLDAFSYTVSHDLRAPLRAMQGLAGALAEDEADRLSPDGVEYARRIIASGRRMERLIGDLLDYSRVSRAHLRLSSVSLDGAVTAALSQLREQISGRGAQVRVVDPLGRVVGHRATLVQVIANLVGNALKFVPEGVLPRVVIRSELRDAAWRLWVEDNGIGVDGEFVDRIFRPFERLHGVESYPGTGIGLAIVRKGVERMGGQAGVEPGPDGGARFWIELPVARGGS